MKFVPTVCEYIKPLYSTYKGVEDDDRKVLGPMKSNFKPIQKFTPNVDECSFDELVNRVYAIPYWQRFVMKEPAKSTLENVISKIPKTDFTGMKDVNKSELMTSIKWFMYLLGDDRVRRPMKSRGRKKKKKKNRKRQKQKGFKTTTVFNPNVAQESSGDESLDDTQSFQVVKATSGKTSTKVVTKKDDEHKKANDGFLNNLTSGFQNNKSKIMEKLSTMDLRAFVRSIEGMSILKIRDILLNFSVIQFDVSLVQELTQIMNGCARDGGYADVVNSLTRVFKNTLHPAAIETLAKYMMKSPIDVVKIILSMREELKSIIGNGTVVPKMSLPKKGDVLRTESKHMSRFLSMFTEEVYGKIDTLLTKGKEQALEIETAAAAETDETSEGAVSESKKDKDDEGEKKDKSKGKADKNEEEKNRWAVITPARKELVVYFQKLVATQQWFKEYGIRQVAPHLSDEECLAFICVLKESLFMYTYSFQMAPMFAKLDTDNNNELLYQIIQLVKRSTNSKGKLCVSLDTVMSDFMKLLSSVENVDLDELFDEKVLEAVPAPIRKIIKSFSDEGGAKVDEKTSMEELSKIDGFSALKSKFTSMMSITENKE